MLIVEVEIKLDKYFEYYNILLKNNGLVNDFKIATHDIYYTDKNLDGLSENEVKNACIRLRSSDNLNYKIQNNVIDDLGLKEVTNDELTNFEKRLGKLGCKKVFDTTKKDFHYYKDGMSSKVQLQQTENIGLLVYYDNKDYYEFDLGTQRKQLINELNSCGFDLSNAFQRPL